MRSLPRNALISDSIGDLTRKTGAKLSLKAIYRSGMRTPLARPLSSGLTEPNVIDRHGKNQWARQCKWETSGRAGLRFSLAKSMRRSHCKNGCSASKTARRQQPLRIVVGVNPEGYAGKEDPTGCFSTASGTGSPPLLPITVSAAQPRTSSSQKIWPCLAPSLPVSSPGRRALTVGSRNDRLGLI